MVMGVSGSGKSTFGARLATTLGWDFEEGDQLHPAANVAKMSRGEPLDDADREPWLDAVRGWIDAELQRGRSGVITCSALKRSYRERLRRPGVRFVHLEVPRAELQRRLRGRVGHYMPASLLDSQLATLETPEAAERVITLSAQDPDGAVSQVLRELDLRPAGRSQR